MLFEYDNDGNRVVYLETDEHLRYAISCELEHWDMSFYTLPFDKLVKAVAENMQWALRTDWLKVTSKDLEEASKEFEKEI